jgi:hypothetical protein
MAWEAFWKADPTGRRITTDPQLAAFRIHFADRLVEPIAEIGRPRIMVLEKPYKLMSLQTPGDYEQLPVLLRDIQGWPPSLSFTNFGHFPKPGEAEVIDARVVSSARAGAPPILMIRGVFQEQEGKCSITGYPAIFLECIAKTLNEHPGESFRSLSDLELSGAD